MLCYFACAGTAGWTVLSCRTLKSLDRQVFTRRCFLPQFCQLCARVNLVSNFHSVPAREGIDKRIDFRIGSGVGKVDLSLKRRSQRTVWYTEQWCTSHSFWTEVLVLTSLCFGNLCFSQVFQRLNFLSCGYKVNWIKRFFKLRFRCEECNSFYPTCATLNYLMT